MALVINSNIASLNSQRHLTGSQSSLNTSLERLSSGLRINSAKDDAAGLAISERFTTQIRGLNQAARNANDGISLAQTAEGALGGVTDMLQRVRELSVQSANATNSASDRAALQGEVDQLVEEINRVAQTTSFNNVNLLDGTFTAQSFQVGANAGQTITIDSISSARASDLGQYQGFSQTFTLATANDTAVAKNVTVGTTVYDLGSVADDARAIASALNAAGIAGLQATAGETSVAGQTSAVTGANLDADVFVLNGVNINLTNSGDAATNRSSALAAINAQSAVTGVVATENGSQIDLVAADGRNITTAFAAGNLATIADYGVATVGTSGGSVSLSYKAPSGVTGDFAFTTGFNAGDFSTQTIATTGTAISAVDISTAAGANTAMNAVDAALDSINSSRADLGALQNRFEAVVSNIGITSENLSAARSRIMDADFAAETAEMTRAQILQQAGVAMVSQANSQPQLALSLLQ
ncbi:MAG: flagellin [Thiohalobacteraceae bacterium]